MKKVFVDSNVFLRFLNKDEPKHALAAEALFQKAKNGEIELLCGPPVLFEVAWVLRSFYKKPAADILDILESILAVPGITFFDTEYASQAIRLAREKNTGFADSYIAVSAANNGAELATFNTEHFKRLGAELFPL
jgi:predicted nucleic acid-binding protein